MPTARLLPLALASLLLATAAPAQEEPAAPAEPSGQISTEADARGDAAIERRIEGILTELGGYGGVGVTVREGIVTFRGEALDPAAVAELDALAARVDGVVATRNEVVESTDVRQRLDPVAERFGARARQVVAYLPLLLVALLVGAAVAGLGIALARWERPWRRLAPNPFIAEIYRVILRLAFVVAGVVLALDILGATALLTGLFGAAGIVGLAVGFAVRDVVENFIASILLSLRQPFRPNDIVDIDGTLGTVVSLSSRATILLDPDGNHVRLSNSAVFKAKIVNFTRNETRRFGFTLGIDPNDDLAAAKRIGEATLAGLPFVLSEPVPQAWIEASGESTVTMAFHAWIDQRASNFPVARGEAVRAVMSALTKAGIGLPEPSYRLRILGGGVPTGEASGKADRGTSAVITEAEEAPPDTAAVAAEDGGDACIARMAAAERRQGRGADLLRPDAPWE